MTGLESHGQCIDGRLTVHGLRLTVVVMKTYAQAIDLVDDDAKIDEYIEHHQNVWPEVIAGLRRIGITRMAIYRTGTRLVMVFDAPDDFDPSRDYQAATADPRTRAWDDLMRTYQRRVPTAGPDDWWTPMEEVFQLSHYDTDRHGHQPQ